MEMALTRKDGGKTVEPRLTARHVLGRTGCLLAIDLEEMSPQGVTGREDFLYRVQDPVRRPPAMAPFTAEQHILAKGCGQDSDRGRAARARRVSDLQVETGGVVCGRFGLAKLISAHRKEIYCQCNAGGQGRHFVCVDDAGELGSPREYEELVGNEMDEVTNNYECGHQEPNSPVDTDCRCGVDSSWSGDRSNLSAVR